MFNAIIFVFGLVLAMAGFYFIRDAINVESCLRTNYRDKKISSLGGIYYLLPFLIIILIVQIKVNINNDGPIDFQATSILVIGFAFLGLLDDLVGDKSSQGFKGHIKALMKGKMTTGAIKLFGGPSICLIALLPFAERTGYEVVILGSIAISLTANLVNLLDLAPGRALKMSSLAMLGGIIISTHYSWQYGMLGILVVLLVIDLKELMMLGDVGSNAIGAVVGLSLINNMSLAGIYMYAIFVFCLNLLSEFVSFSKIINSFPPLRFLDTLGQTKERKEWLKNKLSKA